VVGLGKAVTSFMVTAMGSKEFCAASNPGVSRDPGGLCTVQLCRQKGEHSIIEVSSHYAHCSWTFSSFSCDEPYFQA